VRLGGDVNLSGLPAEQERFAVAHELQLVRSLPNLRDPTFLRRLITQWQKELELPDAVPLEPLKVLQRRRLLSFVEYGQERVSVMERGQE
jgi:hypothetical protein